jgi:hypothetical protein
MKQASGLRPHGRFSPDLERRLAMRVHESCGEGGLNKQTVLLGQMLREEGIPCEDAGMLVCKGYNYHIEVGAEVNGLFCLYRGRDGRIIDSRKRLTIDEAVALIGVAYTNSFVAQMEDKIAKAMSDI